MNIKLVWTMLVLKGSWEINSNTKSHKNALLAQIYLTHPKYVLFSSLCVFDEMP